MCLKLNANAERSVWPKETDTKLGNFRQKLNLYTWYYTSYPTGTNVHSVLRLTFSRQCAITDCGSKGKKLADQNAWHRNELLRPLQLQSLLQAEYTDRVNQNALIHMVQSTGLASMNSVDSAFVS